MPLRALYDLYDRIANDPDYALARPGRSIQQIGFVVVIERDGRFCEIQDIRHSSGSSQPRPRRVEVLGIGKPSGIGYNPCFLWDAPHYLLGFPRTPGERKRAREAFEAFKQAHLKVRGRVAVPEFGAVCSFLSAWDPSKALEYKEALGLPGFGVFQIRGQESYVHEHPAIQEWWDKWTKGDPKRMQRWPDPPRDTRGAEGQCLVTGRSNQRIARLHPKIKGVAGAQTSGATIAGFNKAAFCSYALEQSLNAPVSEEAARRYTAALNALLAGPKKHKHRVVVGQTTIVFWTERPTQVEDVFAHFAQWGSEDQEAAMSSTQDPALRQKLQAFLQALRKGKEAYGELADDPEQSGFHVLGLAAPTPARIAVRFYHHSTVADLLDRLRIHHTHIDIEREFGQNTRQPALLSISRILDQTCPWTSDDGKQRPAREHIPPLLGPALLEAILTGKRYPDGMYLTILRRIATDHIVNHPRAAMIKGILIRNHSKEVPVSLDTGRSDPAYRLGRLFAVLEHAQWRALGSELNATLRDRFYSTASCTPAAVFPRLLRTHQHHVGKLEPRGIQIFYDRLVSDILEPLDAFPAHLDLVEQGLFALGYYHQRNDLYRKKDSTGETTDSAAALEGDIA